MEALAGLEEGLERRTAAVAGLAEGPGRGRVTEEAGTGLSTVLALVGVQRGSGELGRTHSGHGDREE